MLLAHNDIIRPHCLHSMHKMQPVATHVTRIATIHHFRTI